METQNHKKFKKIFERIDYAKHNLEKFRDFCTMSAYALALPFYPDKAKEKLKMVYNKYKKEDIIKFDQLFTIMVDALEEENQDFLGVIFSLYEFGNARTGQFFTPYHLSLMMAQMSLGDMRTQIEERGFISICEPACGSGGMVIACREVMINAQCNPSNDAYFEITDIDELAFLMSYVQISLYGLAARVIHGNSITREIYNEMLTPVYFLNGWAPRIAFKNLLRLDNENQEYETKAEDKARSKESINKTASKQLELF